MHRRAPHRRVLVGLGLCTLLLAAPSVGASWSEPAAPSASVAVPVLTAVPSSLSCTGLAGLPSSLADGWAAPGVAAAAVTGPSDYYAIDLVPTGRVPGTGLAKGVAYQTAARSPFFGVALAPSGEYLHDLDIQADGLKPLSNGAYVAWVTDTDVKEIVRLGALDATLRIQGPVAWNKFLVVITREPSSEPADIWEGPIIMRGMSRSGLMHTMAGHGPFQAEPCAKYGFR